MFTRAEQYLKGKKTYILAGLIVLIGVVEFISGDVTFVELVTTLEAMSDPAVLTVLTGGAFAALRAGMAK